MASCTHANSAARSYPPRICSGGCFQMTTVMKINADGSGTVEHRMLSRRSGANCGSSRPLAADARRSTSEQQAREMRRARSAVTYVSSTPVRNTTGEGRDAVVRVSRRQPIARSRTAGSGPAASDQAVGVKTDARPDFSIDARRERPTPFLHVNALKRAGRSHLVEPRPAAAAAAGLQIAARRRAHHAASSRRVRSSEASNAVRRHPACHAARSGSR